MNEHYQELFEHLNNEHGLILLESEMDEIITICERFLNLKHGATMKKQYEQVKQFHEVFGINIEPKPIIPNDERCRLRFVIQAEELDEFAVACVSDDLTEVVDAVIDQLYILFGTALEFGLSVELLEECFDEVHRSNMSKLDGNGKPVRRADGKVIKGKNYSRPNLAPIIEKYINPESV